MQVNKALIENIPPHSAEAEQAVLGGIFLAPDVLDKISDVLEPDDFHIQAHSLIYAACLELWSKGKPVDLPSVHQHLRDTDKCEEGGGAVYLATLLESATSSTDANHFASIVKDKSTLRKLIHCCTEVIEKSLHPVAEIDAILDETETNILSVTRSNAKAAYSSVSEVMDMAFSKMTADIRNNKGLTGIDSGYRSINRLTGGFQRSDLIILAARPAMGKSSFAYNIALRSALQGTPVALFSLERSSVLLVQRLLCIQAEVDLSKLRRNTLEDTDWIKLQRAAEAMDEIPLFIDDTTRLTIRELCARARALKRKKDIQMIIVDYLHLMRASSPVESREQEIAEISRGLKELAKELDIPVIAISTLNRKLEERYDKRPMFSDLRESGALEQDADVIMFLYRDSVYQRLDERPENDLMEVIFAKHRNGSVGTIDLKYIPRYTKFDELIYRHLDE